MNQIDVVELTKKLVEMPSASQQSNELISNYLQGFLAENGFEVERLEYRDPNGYAKVSLVAKLGNGEKGLAFCSHTDTVPGQEADWQPWTPVIKDGLLYGRGSCDMKGPLAATIVAALGVDASQLKRPLFIIATADEEIGLLGAKHVAQESQLLKQNRPAHGIIAEPTEMIPVYAHKGMGEARVTAYGRAAHTSSGKGESATFKIAPFMAEMAELERTCRQDPYFQDDEFDPPTNGMNISFTDFGCASNVTAPKAECRVGIRAMPKGHTAELMQIITDKATEYGFEVATRLETALFVSKEAPIVREACAAIGVDQPQTVPYGTDGLYLQQAIDDLVVFGPGDIGVAHTVGEFVPLVELHQAVNAYTQLIERLCMNNDSPSGDT